MLTRVCMFSKDKAIVAIVTDRPMSHTSVETDLAQMIRAACFCLTCNQKVQGNTDYS